MTKVDDTAKRLAFSGVIEFDDYKVQIGLDNKWRLSVRSASGKWKLLKKVSDVMEAAIWLEIMSAD